MRDGEISVPQQGIEFGYVEDDSEEAFRTSLSSAISVILSIALGAFAAGVGQGIFEDKNNRIVDMLCPKTSALRLLAGKVVGLGIFGWLQLLIFGLIVTVPLTFFADFDWQRLLLPPYMS